MKKILGYLGPYKKLIIKGLSVKSFATIMELFLPWLLAYMIDYIIPTKSIPKVLLYGALMLGEFLIGIRGKCVGQSYGCTNLIGCDS